MLKISIITACFNNAATLEQTLQSVASQSYKNIEHIIIDGASTDGTLEIIQSHISHLTSHISVKLISEPDNGIYDALNKGIQLATGDMVGFLHADDLFYSNTALETIANAFQRQPCDGVYGNLQYVSKDNTDTVIRNWVSNEFTLKKLKKGWMPPHPTLYLKREVYNKFGLFDVTFHIAADYDFMLRVFSGGISACFVPVYLVKMRVGGKSNAFKNLINKMKEDLKALRKNNVGGIYSLFLKNVTKVPQFFK